MACTLEDMDDTSVSVVTNRGSFVIALDAGKAPKSVANFLRYVDSNFYDGTTFHRVISNFMIQGGGYDKTYERKPTQPPIENEADNGLKNKRGTVAMARTADPNSATAQFFVNVTDNDFLDHTAKTAQGWGYAVFGRVTEGMETVDKIKNEKTGAAGPFAKDVPQQPVIILSVRRV